MVEGISVNSTEKLQCNVAVSAVATSATVVKKDHQGRRRIDTVCVSQHGLCVTSAS